MTEDERYFFDVQGYLVLEDAIAPGALLEMNAWIDAQEEAGPDWRARHGSLLTWGPTFRALLDNPRVLPYLMDILGPDLRLDHDYPIFSQPGAPGMELHGGCTPYDPSQYYHCYDGKNPFRPVGRLLRAGGYSPGSGRLRLYPGQSQGELFLSSRHPALPAVVPGRHPGPH